MRIRWAIPKDVDRLAVLDRHLSPAQLAQAVEQGRVLTAWDGQVLAGWLRWRLDKAKECYEQNPCYMVVTGGQGGQEPAPEGDVMRAVLIAEGLSEEHVISDPHSADTKENIRNAWAILQEKGCKKPLIVTSDYHLPRALAIARDAGLEAQGAGSPCRPEWNYWLKNHMREALAWVKYWGVKYLGLKL